MLSICMGFGPIPETVNAAEYEAVVLSAEEATERWTQEEYESFMENSPYGPYEALTEAQKAIYSRIQQYLQKRQQWRQERLPYTEPRDLEAEAAAAAAETARLAAEHAARIAEEQARLEEELKKIWHNPLTKDTYVSSPFGMRKHPVYKVWKMHKGVDLDSDRGDEIIASRGGVVVAAGWHESYGYYVRIDHGDGFMSEYFHMSKYYVKRGQEVEACELIGRVGSTGVSTGSHLHFGIILNGDHVDPEDYIDFEK